jgi:hypothetical protein
MSEPHRRHITDTRTLLSVTLQQRGETGTLAAVNLTGLATPQFKLVNAATGVEAIAATSTGVTVDDATAGEVSYRFSSGGVDEAGIYWGYFIATQTSRTDHFPVDPGGLIVEISSDTITAQAAYRVQLEG